MKQQRNRRRLILVDLDETVRRVFSERESAAVNQDVGSPQSDPDFARTWNFGHGFPMMCLWVSGWLK